MKTKYKSLIKDTFFFALGNLGSKLILFFLVPIYTNYLTQAQYGTTELIYTFQQLILPFVSVVIFDGVVRFGLSKFEKKEDVLLVSMVVALVGSIITIGITPLIGLYESISSWQWYLCAYIILSMFSSIFQNYLKVKNKNLLYAITAILQTLSLAGLNIVFLCVKNMGVQGYMLATICASLIPIIIPICFGGVLVDLSKAKWDKDLFKRMIKFSAPCILNNISWWIIHSADRLMIEIMISTAALGLYTVAAKIPSLINVVTSIFQQAWGISTIKEIENSNDKDFYSEVFTMFIVVVCGMAIAITLIIKPFMSIYVGKDFIDAWKYVPMLLAAAVFCAISTYWGSLYGALKKSFNSMITTLIAAVVNVILNFFLIKSIGVWGAIIATVVSYFVISFIRMIDVNRYIHMKINYLKLIINSGLVLFATVCASLDFYIYIISAISLVVFILINLKDIVMIVKRVFKDDKNKEVKENENIDEENKALCEK